MMSRNVKLLIYKTIIWPVVTYASHTWVLTKENESLKYTVKKNNEKDIQPNKWRRVMENKNNCITPGIVWGARSGSLHYEKWAEMAGTRKRWKSTAPKRCCMADPGWGKVRRRTWVREEWARWRTKAVDRNEWQRIPEAYFLLRLQRQGVSEWGTSTYVVAFLRKLWYK
jgi:hypothetical protein